jgi:hypothetical protein
MMHSIQVRRCHGATTNARRIHNVHRRHRHFCRRRNYGYYPGLASIPLASISNSREVAEKTNDAPASFWSKPATVFDRCRRRHGLAFIARLQCENLANTQSQRRWLRRLSDKLWKNMAHAQWPEPHSVS